ncbi:MAG: DUF4249 domain-containing protein [Cyclobacteriaceae bacterium]
MKNQIIYSLIVMVIFISCEETILIDTDQTPSKIIIEGLVTTEMKQHTIKITRTADFYQTGLTPRVSDATISVSDDAGNSYAFSEEQPGLYLSQEPFSGIIGNTYTMQVNIGPDAFTATEQLLRVTTVDSLSYELNFDETEESNIALYSFFLYTVEPQETRDYYLFKFYRNGTWLNENGEDITVTDDVAVGEEIEGIEAPYLYVEGDTARVEMYSLTRDAYIFWFDVANLVFSDGGVFAPLPANPRTNITGGALGIFQVSDVQGGEIVIK